MKKKLLLVMVAVVTVCCACGVGNKDIFDTVYTYNYAILSLPNGEIVEGKVQTWGDYENSDQIQVKIDNKYYLVHSEDVVLIAE